MICKEDIVSWFKELESYRRIDIMCTLLNMCLPFELRFLGTCLEELGRRDSQELRGIELRVNNPQELSSDIASCQSGEPTDLKIRRKMALYLALIRACNRSCVNELFKTLDSWGELDFQKLSDVDTLHELLLVYSMATNHPVFSFEQRFKCNEIFLKIQDNKLISGSQLPHLHQTQSQQQQQQQQSHQQQHQPQQPFGDQQLHLSGQLHNLHGGPQQHLLHSIPLIPPYIHQLIPPDGSIQHPISVDGMHMIQNMALPSDFVTHPNALWQIRPNMASYPLPPQPPSLEQHPPQSSSPLLSQPTSPSNSRTTSPNRTTSSNMLQQTGGNQQQQLSQIRNQQSQQQRINVRNSRRPSVETTPPPVIQSQQQQLINLIGTEMILPQSLKNMDELINADGSISQFNRNGYTRPGHHTIPRQSKTAMQHMQHHNQQQQLQQLPQHQHLQSFITSTGGGPASLPPNFSGVNPNITYTLQNMTLVDLHNPILENNVMSSSTSSSLTSRGHKSSSTGGGAGSDSGSSGSTGDISPPETPTLLINTSGPQGVGVGGNAGGRLNDQTSVNYSNRRLNGRPDKLLTSVSSIGGSNQQQIMYAPNATSPPQSQPQFLLSNDHILTTNPSLIQSPVSNNNNNSSNNLINSINSVVSGSSNNNLVTSTLVITTPQQQFSSGGTFPAPYHSQHLAAAMQAAAAAGTPTRPPILSHNPGIGPGGIGPGTFRHPSFQIQSNGEPILYYQPGVAAALSQFMAAPPPPNAGQTSIHRSSPSTVTTGMPPPPQQIVVSTSQQQQQQQQSQQLQTHTQTVTQTQSTLPPNPSPSATLLTAALPFTTLTVGGKQIISCFNCGSQNHTGRECHEPSLEDVTRGAIYKLDYTTSAISPAAGGVSVNSSNISSSNNNSNSNTAIIINNPSSTTTSIINNSSTNINNSSSSSSSSNNSQLNQNNSEILNETSSPASSSSSLSLSNK